MGGRSGSQDFQDIVEFYKNYPEVIERLSLLKGQEFEVKSINDAINAFESDLSTSWGKTVIKWVM